tara:strand:+ start:8488 stop:9657 length:1170 start_codon:yes stop_codon:yes gene_type:complete
MANKKITELTELNATPANDDELVIVDTDAAATKRISVNNLMAAGGGGGARTIDTKTTDYTLVSGDLGKVIACDSSSNDITITVPNTSTLGAGFYCYVVQTAESYQKGSGFYVAIDGAASVETDAREFAKTSKVFLKGQGAYATITNYATDKYFVDGDVGNLYGFASIVCDRTKVTNYLNFDDNSENNYASSGYTDWDGSNQYYGKITGPQLSGNYKYYAAGGGYITSDVDSAFGQSGASTPNIESNSYVNNHMQGSGFYEIYVYCGDGTTITTVDAEDMNGVTIPVMPFFHKMNSSSQSSYAFALGMWYYGSSGGSVSEAAVTSSTGVSDYYGVGYFGRADSGFGPGEQDIAFGGIHETSAGAGVNLESSYPEFGTTNNQLTPVGKLFI